MAATKRSAGLKPAPRGTAAMHTGVSKPRRPGLRGPRKRLSFTARILLAFAGLAVALLVWAAAARAFQKSSNTGRQTFDAIVVLGTPADSDGNPTPSMQDRVTEAVREYQRGIAPRLIVTGGAAHNGFVEADAMARVAEAQGVPASVIYEEPQALDTMQNACYSARIMKSHGWRSMEVVSSPSHLPRAAMIFSRLPLPNLEWRTHAAPLALTSGAYDNSGAAVEVLKTARYLAWARWTEQCEL